MREAAILVALCHLISAQQYGDYGGNRNDGGGLGNKLYANSQDADCTCAGYKPCMHAFSDQCFALTDHIGGVRTCPAETSHCQCPCTGRSPCHNPNGIILNAEAQARNCLDTVVMFGQEVCPAGTIHCRAYETVKGAPTPAPWSSAASAACPCTLAKPCKSNTAVDGEESCVAQDSDGLCPTGHTECLPEGLTPSCACGGGRPCQFLHSHECFEKGMDQTGVMQCPPRTMECDCPCPNNAAAGPCYGQVGGKDFCYPLNGEGFCSEGLTHCQRTQGLPEGHVYQDLSKITSHTTSIGDPVATDSNSKCDVLEWSDWQPCSAPCGGGVRERHALVYGLDSPGNCHEVEREQCNMHACDPRDCIAPLPDHWGKCTMSCGGGWEEKKPKVVQQAKDGGKPCPSTLRRPCNTHSCNTQPDCNCAMGIVGNDATPEAKTPGLSTRCHRVGGNIDGVMHVVHAAEGNHHYNCRYDPKYGCQCCHCNTVMCEASDWSAWSSCSHVTGYKTRTRRLEGFTFYLRSCPTQTETRQCGHGTHQAL